ncbi:exo-alpha-sialidase [Parapedobacter sp. SGR-10]|uniref:sialidase family protein n=1 Tax=Parapedobacter sp. SGR-10 TaxID=2710879 RepID=UPI0013D141FB|nr:sialidase family protein [Parapedobacter sp. SGR-10]NGF57610.1 exo-alpha-sialidase [Parapedobacter sp. SGR-10]
MPFHKLQKTHIFILSFFLSSAVCFAQEDYNYIFQNETEGYNCFRIPAIIKAPNGDLLAFAEARKKDCDDFGDVDLVMKRSRNKGKTWSTLEIIADNGAYKAGDPAPVVDFQDPQYPKGRIFILYNTGTATEFDLLSGNGLREVFYKTSSDNGKTWSEAVNITTQVHRPKLPQFNPAYNFEEDWRTMTNTPGHAIQIKQGKYKGRLYIAANHSVGDKPKNNFNNYRSHGFFSDDHGKTWKLGSDIDFEAGNESIAAELSDGSILQNVRLQSKKYRYRLLAYSKTAGQSWDTVYLDKQLPDPICQGSMLDIKHKKKHIILFSNPDSQFKREKMTIRASWDDGKTWKTAFLVDEGASAYSDLVEIDQKCIGIVYERGNKGGIVFAHFPTKKILDK